MSQKVTLDALIPREDFDIKDATSQNVSRSKGTLSINDLKQGEFFFSGIRKPDFQRETNEWDTDKICSFIKSFLGDELIPAIILWKSTGNFTFVIDGSHRISALAAWVNDDYGDGVISKSFYNLQIPRTQDTIAANTRKLINKEIGPFSDYVLAVIDPQNKAVRQEIKDKASSLGTLSIQLQWVEGDAAKAEDSFRRINLEPVPINPTELKLLSARRQSNAIAARAIIRSGTGHKYWLRFDETTQNEIETIAKEVHNLLFEPPLDTPIKTLDIPIGGKNYSAQTLPLIFDFVNIANDITIGKKKQRNQKPNTTGKNNNQSQEPDNELLDDADGSETIKVLKNCRKILRRISAEHPSSLGLHPIIYFYSSNGRFKIGSFLAITGLMLEFEKRNMYQTFTKVRANFEDFIYQNDYLVQQIIRKYRTTADGYKHACNFYLLCIKKLTEGITPENLLNAIIQEQEFSYLTQTHDNSVEPTSKAEFSTETKSAIYIRAAVPQALRCQICNGYIHLKSISPDHKQRKRDGGLGTVDNGQLTHYYCNSTIKN